MLVISVSGLTGLQHLLPQPAGAGTGTGPESVAGTQSSLARRSLSMLDSMKGRQAGGKWRSRGRAARQQLEALAGRVALHKGAGFIRAVQGNIPLPVLEVRGRVLLLVPLLLGLLRWCLAPRHPVSAARCACSIRQHHAARVVPLRGACCGVCACIGPLFNTCSPHHMLTTRHVLPAAPQVRRRFRRMSGDGQSPVGSDDDETCEVAETGAGLLAGGMLALAQAEDATSNATLDQGSGQGPLLFVKVRVCTSALGMGLLCTCDSVMGMPCAGVWRACDMLGSGCKWPCGHAGASGELTITSTCAVLSTPDTCVASKPTSWLTS